VTPYPIPEVMDSGKTSSLYTRELRGSRFGGGEGSKPSPPPPPPPSSSCAPAFPGLCPHHHHPYFMTKSQDTQFLFKFLIWKTCCDGCSLHWSIPFLTDGFSNPYI